MLSPIAIPIRRMALLDGVEKIPNGIFSIGKGLSLGTSIIDSNFAFE